MALVPAKEYSQKQDPSRFRSPFSQRKFAVLTPFVGLVYTLSFYMVLHVNGALALHPQGIQGFGGGEVWRAVAVISLQTTRSVCRLSEVGNGQTCSHFTTPRRVPPLPAGGTKRHTPGVWKE